MTDVFTEAQREALIAAGGCPHTPNPFVMCDTCGRPSIASTHASVIGYSFVAETVDGGVIVNTPSDAQEVKLDGRSATERAASVSHLPLDAVRRLIVLTNNPRIPRVTIDVDPEKGERLFRFSRVAKKVSIGDGRSVGDIRVECLEVANAEGFKVRLYLHPTLGPILSTKDLYF